MLDQTKFAIEETGKIVIFTAAGQDFGIDIRAVCEIRGWTRETPLPQAPAYMRGVVNLRGVVLPIVDLSARLGLPPCAPSPRHVIIIIAAGPRLLGLLVDAVSDIVALSPADVQPCADIACGASGQFLVGLISSAERLVGLLAVEHLLEPEREAAA